MLSLWLIDMGQANGTEYEPNSLASYLSAIKCHLGEIGIDIKNGHDKQGDHCEKGDKVTGEGCLKNRISCLSVGNEEHLWESGALRGTNPEALAHAVWYLTTKYLRFRRCQGARQLKWGNSTFHVYNGSTYLEWNEGPTYSGNNRNGGEIALIKHLTTEGTCFLRTKGDGADKHHRVGLGVLSKEKVSILDTCIRGSWAQWLATIRQATHSSLRRRREVIRLGDGKSDRWWQHCHFCLFSPSKRNNNSRNWYTSKNITFSSDYHLLLVAALQ